MKYEKLITQFEQQRRTVDFDTYDITVQQLLAMVEDKAIDIAPTYERQFRWEPYRRSQLIESILLGIPFPSLFMATNKDGTWELVDGVQRINSIIQFAGNLKVRKLLKLHSSLALYNLEKLSEFNG